MLPLTSGAQGLGLPELLLPLLLGPEAKVQKGGVMGGLETEVTADTVNVMLEAATFNGPSIRRTSKALGLRSEASGRFERGTENGKCAFLKLQNIVIETYEVGEHAAQCYGAIDHIAIDVSDVDRVCRGCLKRSAPAVCSLSRIF